jgi:SAM-dependent methyltransferase
MRKSPVPEQPIPLLPALAPSQLLSKGVPIRILEPAPADGNISLYELIIIVDLIQTLKPTRLLEIGTFDGRTTLNMAANSSPGAVVFTLDLPKDSLNSTLLPLAPFDAKFIANQAKGSKFADSEYQSKIVQLWGDSATFDFSPFVETMDFVFIDASHSYEYALQDSRTALRLLRNQGGVVLWHDYDTPWWPGVTRALNDLFVQGGAFGGLRHIEGTALAYLALGGNPGESPSTSNWAGVPGSANKL